MIEFIDYNCGYCKRTLDAVLKLSKEDSDLQVTFKEFTYEVQDLRSLKNLTKLELYCLSDSSKYFDFQHN